MDGCGAGRQDAGSACVRGVKRGPRWRGWVWRSSAWGFVALVVAYLFFGWPVLLVGMPAFIAVDLVVVAVLVSEAPRRRLEAHRATRFDPRPSCRAV